MLSLYFAPGTSSMAPHIALHEIGVPFESCPLSFAKNEQEQSSYLLLNAEGKVPTLLVDGRPLTEVAAILYYLARKFPEAGLMPKGDAEREAHVISWMSFIASTLHPARRQGLDHVTEVWTLAERKFGERGWALGAYSVVDIHLFRLYWRMRNAPRPYPKGLRRLEALYEKMMARPAVQRTIEIESRIGYELPA